MQTTRPDVAAAMCGKRTARFMCTLPAGHGGPHGRAYRRQAGTARLEVLPNRPQGGRMCDCESAGCHEDARCPNKATAMVRAFGIVAALCDHCRRELIAAIARTQPLTAPAKRTPKLPPGYYFVESDGPLGDMLSVHTTDGRAVGSCGGGNPKHLPRRAAELAFRHYGATPLALAAPDLLAACEAFANIGLIATDGKTVGGRPSNCTCTTHPELLAALNQASLAVAMVKGGAR